MFVLHVNSDALVRLTNNLEKLSSTAFPNVVRKTLNETALDVKKRTLQASASASFTLRNKNFFKRFSRVNFVQERRIVGNMSATVGMDSSGLSGANNHAIENLDKQEHGGRISGRTFIPTATARVSNSWGRNVRKQNRISEAKNIAKAKGKTKGEWLKAAKDVGVGGLIFGSFSPMVFRITAISGEGGKIKVKTKAVYHFKKGKSFTPSSGGRGFARRAAEESASRMPDIYYKEAEKRFERILI